jgi:dihydropteroate synthase
MSASPAHPRPAFDWRLRTRTLPLGHRTAIMGILNVTPDSFSDGGRFFSPTTALDQALRMLDEGADLLDLGGESTRPTSTPILPEEEQSRVLPVIDAILHHRPDAILSIDTYHATTARCAIEAGAEIVNDVSGCLWDPTMASAIADLHCGAVLMHTRGRPEDWPTLEPLAPTEILLLVLAGLGRSLDLAHAAGIAPDQIVLDPGFGFGKLGTENYTLLAHLADFHQLRLPILSGISRKGFLTRTIAALDPPTADPVQPIPAAARATATQAANVASILAGAHILRVHDVRATRESAAIADAILVHA